MNKKINNNYENLDFEKFLSRLDLKWDKLEYSGLHMCNDVDKAPLEWGSSAFMGNGMIGCTIYKDTENTLKWELGRNDVEAHNFIQDVDWCIPRVLIGDILITPKGKIINDSMKLNLWNATTFINIKTTQGELIIKSFVQTNLDIIVIDIETRGDEEPVLGVRPKHGITPRYSDVDKRIDTKYLPPLPYNLMVNNTDVNIQEFINEDLKQEGERAFAYKEYKLNKNKFVFLISITNSQYDNNARNEAVKLVNRMDFTELENSHKKWWNDYYKKSFLSIPDTRWEAFYWIQMYKFASATRENMQEAVDNQGPWMSCSTWPGTWWNLNVQLTYSPIYKANRAETGKSLINSIEKNFQVLTENAKPLGIEDGLFLSRSTGRYLYNPAPSYEEIMDKNNKLYGFELGNFTWVCFLLWRLYRSIMDDEFLERFYRILKATINVHLKIMFKDENGKYHLPRTTSPEYPEPGVNPTSYPSFDTTYDLSLFYWGCKTLIEVTKKLDISDPLQNKWQDVIENLTEFPCNENGLMVGAEVPFSQAHRHYSHLFPIYPLHLWDVEDVKLYELSKKSIYNFLFNEDGSDRTGDMSGFTFTGSAAMLATLGKGNKSLEVLHKFRKYLQPNTMFVEWGGQCIETPFCAAESIHYFLLQCYGDTVKVFPAIPDKWENVCFAKLLAEGAFEIGGKRENGINKYVHIKSLAGSPLKLKPNLMGEVKSFFSNKNSTIQKLNGDIYEIIMEKGSEALLYIGDNMPNLEIAPVSSEKEYENYYGERHGKSFLTF